ncbi:MAG: hypothetical protein H3C34_01840 [Caldilineaceae bacterium]|nr:hypothetical protein [Caldilineaceae bacterium]
MLNVRTLLRWGMAALMGAEVLLAGASARPVYAQEEVLDCDAIQAQWEAAVAPAICDTVALGNACYGSHNVQAALAGPATFAEPGDAVALRTVRSLETRAPSGAAFILAGYATDPVKLLLFGDATLAPATGQSAMVVNLTARDGRLVCQRTPSGMLIQSLPGESGSLIVNGVTIRLGSTALVVVNSDLLYDQDPRLEEQHGSEAGDTEGAMRLCAGFSSDCAYGDCAAGRRLLWGPFCREDLYPEIRKGQYRVTLQGEGYVAVAATDRGMPVDAGNPGGHEMDLPGSFTFCWPGLQPGGAGFELAVRALEDGATLDRVTVEYLGASCAVDDGEDTPADSAIRLMSVYNVEGNVQLAGADRTAAPASGQRIRILFDGRRPLVMETTPLESGAIIRSPLLQWAVEGLGAIAVDRMHGDPGPSIANVVTPTPPQVPPRPSVQATPVPSGIVVGSVPSEDLPGPIVVLTDTPPTDYDGSAGKPVGTSTPVSSP